MLLAKLRVGILGLRRGYSHLRNFMAVEDATVIGAADQAEIWRDRAAQIVDSKQVKLVREFEELLELKPDAVVIASNGRCQAAHAIQALAAGCHVMSEVPGAFTQEEINHIILHAERYERQYMLAENSCFLDFLRYWRKWILEDRFGPISIAEAEYLHYLPTSMVDEQHVQHSPTEWREQDLQGLRPLWRADQPPIQYLTGMLPRKPTISPALPVRTQPGAVSLVMTGFPCHHMSNIVRQRPAEITGNPSSRCSANSM